MIVFRQQSQYNTGDVGNNEVDTGTYCGCGSDASLSVIFAISIFFEIKTIRYIDRRYMAIVIILMAAHYT